MKGFTLIELLAVIVILAIILLIAVPTISGLIEGIKRNSFESSTKLIIKAAEQDYMKRNLTGDAREVEYRFEDSVQTVTPADVDKLAFSGKAPKDGIITVHSDGSVELKISDGKFYTATDGSGKVTEPVDYNSEIHDPLLGEVASWIFEVTLEWGDDTFSIGVVDPNLTINWGDGAETTHTSTGASYITHDYLEGTYNVTVTGTAKHISFCNIIDYAATESCTATIDYLTDILSPIPLSMGLTSANSMFAGSPIISFTTLDFFDEASKNITDMAYMFNEAYDFNHPIGNWNTSKVTTMEQMFSNARAFNQPIGTWDTSSVTDMSFMFDFAYDFNQPIGSWNTSSLINMYSMFYSALDFNQNINSWDTSNVTNMVATFEDAIMFNQPLNNWNVSNVTDMEEMFYNTTMFNQNLSTWCVTNIASKPINFDVSTPAWALPKPIWGTCP